MQRLRPDPPDLDDAALLAAYAYPEDLATPWVRVNFVASADGAVSVDGHSAGLGTPADKRVFGVLRRLAEVVLVGAGTVRAEDYGGARRATHGRDTPPPIAVVTGSAELDPGARLFTDTAVAPVVLTTAAATAHRRQALADAGADVAVLPDLAPATLLGELDRRGLRRVLCEGGPRLHGEMIAADAVDELCLTVSPLLAGGEAGRIAVAPRRPPGDEPSGHALSLVHTLHEDETLLLRYARTRDGTSPIG